MDKIIGRPDMTSAVYRGRKASTQTPPKKKKKKHKAGVSQHYDNPPMSGECQCSGENYNLFLIFAQNIDCGYT